MNNKHNNGSRFHTIIGFHVSKTTLEFTRNKIKFIFKEELILKSLNEVSMGYFM